MFFCYVLVVNSPTFTAIIAAYNEAKTIERVVLDLLKIPFLTEIIVVNDGSTDGTEKIIKKYDDKIKIISYPTNRGKGYAVAQGLKIAVGDLILILDADIVNYTASDLQKLIAPVVASECEFTIKPTDDLIFKRIGGVRCYWRKDLMPLIEQLESTSRYGLEILLNKYFQNKKGKYVKLHDYHHFQKWEKFSLPRALWEYSKEALSIVQQLFKS